MLLIDQTRSRVGWCRHPHKHLFYPESYQGRVEEEIVDSQSPAAPQRPDGNPDWQYEVNVPGAVSKHLKGVLEAP